MAEIPQVTTWFSSCASSTYWLNAWRGRRSHSCCLPPQPLGTHWPFYQTSCPVDSENSLNARTIVCAIRNLVMPWFPVIMTEPIQLNLFNTEPILFYIFSCGQSLHAWYIFHWLCRCWAEGKWIQKLEWGQQAWYHPLHVFNYGVDGMLQRDIYGQWWDRVKAGWSQKANSNLKSMKLSRLDATEPGFVCLPHSWGSFFNSKRTAQKLVEERIVQYSSPRHCLYSHSFSALYSIWTRQMYKDTILTWS